MSDLSFGSLPDLLESNTLSSIPGDLNNLEQSAITNTDEQNKCVVSINLIHLLNDIFLSFDIV